MSENNIYVYYDAVTNHITTRAIDLKLTDFEEVPQNLLLSNDSSNFGRYDVQTNFKILRGRAEVEEFFLASEKNPKLMSEWIDFESLEMMHQLTPNEIAEILYLFHANTSLRSAFFYRLQNDYVYLTLPNGLTRMYYRYFSRFEKRFNRAIREKMTILINEGRPFFKRRMKAKAFPSGLFNEISKIFPLGIKISFQQASCDTFEWSVPIFVIEDELTKLSQSQDLNEAIASITYDSNTKQWGLIYHKTDIFKK